MFNILYYLQLWELSSGLLLCNIVFEQSLTSVAMDTAEQRVFVGTLQGNIYQSNLFEHVGIVTTILNRQFISPPVM